MRARPRGALPGRDRAAAARLRGGRPLTIPAGWQVELGEPFESRYSELVAPARLPDGSEAVLKIQLPDDTESGREADALRFWDGRGAVRLLAHDPAARALLLERCVPGTPLGREYGDDGLAVAAGVMRRLWRPPSDDVPWRQLAVEAERWLDELPLHYERHGRPFEPALLDAGFDALRTLGPTQEDVVLCHQDLHGGNILRAGREPWLVIDPKPIVAERAYDTVAIIRDVSPRGLTLGDVRRRLDVFAGLLDLDRERMRGWGIAKHLAWGLSGDYRGSNIEQARLIAEAIG